MSNFAVTPHINVQNEIGFGKTVLMPGDPLRAKFIAENFFENPVLVNNVRGVNGYTGYYKGVKVSVMASGMGMPAIGIYSHELFNFFGVENIIRVGSAGSIQDHINLYDLVIAQGACTDSNWQSQSALSKGYFAAYPMEVSMNNQRMPLLRLLAVLVAALLTLSALVACGTTGDGQGTTAQTTGKTETTRPVEEMDFSSMDLSPYISLGQYTAITTLSIATRARFPRFINAKSPAPTLKPIR